MCTLLPLRIFLSFAAPWKNAASSLSIGSSCRTTINFPHTSSNAGLFLVLLHSQLTSNSLTQTCPTTLDAPHTPMSSFTRPVTSTMTGYARSSNDSLKLLLTSLPTTILSSIAFCFARHKRFSRKIYDMLEDINEKELNYSGSVLYDTMIEFST